MSFDNKRNGDGKEIPNSFGVESGNSRDTGSLDSVNFIDEDPGFALDELMEQYRPSHIDPNKISDSEKNISDMSIDELFNIVLDESLDDISEDIETAEADNGTVNNAERHDDEPDNTETAEPDLGRSEPDSETDADKDSENFQESETKVFDIPDEYGYDGEPSADDESLQEYAIDNREAENGDAYAPDYSYEEQEDASEDTNDAGDEVAHEVIPVKSEKGAFDDIPFEDVSLDDDAPSSDSSDDISCSDVNTETEIADSEINTDIIGEDSAEDVPLDDVKLDLSIDDIVSGNSSGSGSSFDDASGEDNYTAPDDSSDENEYNLSDDDGIDATENESDSADADSAANQIDATDINLMVAFGLEDELEKTMGADAARKLRKAIDDEQSARDEKRREYEYEFTDRSQIPGIVDAYKSTNKSTLIKLFAASFFAVIVFFFENLSVFGVQFAGALDPAVYPVVYTMVGLQLLLFCCACAYEQILGGLAKLFTGHPCPESITSALVLLSVIYSVLVAVKVDAGNEPKLYNFPVALAVVFTLILAYFNIKREMYSFNIVSSKKPKFAVRRKRVDDITKYGGDAEDESNEIIEVKRVSFVKSYFARTYADSSVVSATVAIIISLALAASVLIGVYVGITSRSFMATIEAMFLTLVFAVPISLLVTYSYPFYCANKKVHADNATIIGESSLEEYSDVSVVTVDDKVVFPTSEVKVQNIRIYNNNRIDSVLYYVSSVFERAGGPLADVFKLSTVETGTSDDVTITENAVGCLAATVDGHKLVFGRVKELDERGLKVDIEITAEDLYMTAENVVMYMFCDGTLAAKMFIRYGVDSGFHEIAQSLADNGVSICIMTSDPNIDDAMVSSRIPMEESPVKVIKLPVDSASAETCGELDTGIVSYGSANSLLQTVTFCGKILNVRKTNFSIAIFSLFVGVAVMLLLALLGKLNVVSSLLVALYQVVWTLPVAITSKLFIK